MSDRMQQLFARLVIGMWGVLLIAGSAVGFVFWPEEMVGILLAVGILAAVVGGVAFVRLTFWAVETIQKGRRERRRRA